MKTNRILLFIGILLSLSSFYFVKEAVHTVDESKFISYQVDPDNMDLQFYWKDDQGQNIKNFKNLKTKLAENDKDLVFAMNGGMYLKDRSPQGLYIEKGQLKKAVNQKNSDYGNFYMKPNGVFYITDSKVPVVCETSQLKALHGIEYATQSGPMLLIDGKLHPQFIKGSKNLNIRNGVGILPNGDVLFAMSKEKVNFYDFATFFKQNDCQNALYLDGFVSRTYLPSEDWMQQDGNFGVIIGVTN
ncbi:phosphodiester glycosidase family protein [bacterium SCSIO 12643]|nr:phosphodiester glycosidase family protein [bacterium SCSIO 12643]